jgi:hypothetical protein
MTRFFALAAVAAAWFAAFSIEFMARGMFGAYQVFGADLPAPTIVTFDAIRAYGAWLVAAAGTVVIGALLLRKSPRLGQACAAYALVIALGVSVTMLSLMLPQVKMCGSFMPDWPDAPKQQVAQAPQPEAGSCGR